MLRVTEQNIFFDKYLSVGHTAAQVESCLWVQAIRIRWSLFVCADYVSDRVCSCVQIMYQMESCSRVQTTYQLASVRVCRLRIRWSLFVCADYVPDAVCSCVQTTYQTGGEGAQGCRGITFGFPTFSTYRLGQHCPPSASLILGADCMRRVVYSPCFYLPFFCRTIGKVGEAEENK